MYPTAKDFVKKIEARDVPSLPDDGYITQLDAENDIIPVFITSYCILHQKRRIYNKENKKLTPSNDWDVKVRTTILAPWMKCSQYGIILAAALFYYNSSSLAFKCRALKYILNSSLNNEETTVSDILKHFKENKIEDSVLDSKITTPVTTALCILSNSLNDPTLGSIAGGLDFNIYMNILIQKHKCWHSNATMMCLARQYLNQFVPKCDHDVKRKEIQDEFALNREACLKRLAARFSTPSSISTNHNETIDKDAQYEVYVGPLNYWKNLSMSIKTVADKTYTVIYFKSIVYDVIAENGQSLLDLPWSERLEKLPNETHIIVKSMIGVEVNDIISSRDASNSLTITTNTSPIRSFNVNIIKSKASIEEPNAKKRKMSTEDSDD